MASGIGARGRCGASPVGSLLALVFGGGLAMVVAALFVTGLAQKEILPRLHARVDRTVAAAKARVGAADPADSSAAADAAGGTAGGPLERWAEHGAESALAGVATDSVEAIRTQVETERVFLEGRERELAQLRHSIDSVMTRFREEQNKETARQARLLAGMRPEEAARVLEAMDDASTASIVAKMNVRVASQVLAKLDAQRVARLSMAAMGQESGVGVLIPPGPSAVEATEPAQNP